MNFKKGLLIGIAALGLSVSAQAANINIGGVVWDPDSVKAGNRLKDFISLGNFSGSVTDNSYFGFGNITQMNNKQNNNFCPSCELTFTLKADLNNGDYSNYTIELYVDHSQNYIDADTGGYAEQADDGDLWLRLTSGVNTTTYTDGSTSSYALLNVDETQGLARGNFDTNTLVGGFDLALLTSGLTLDNVDKQQTLSLAGDSIPEPSSIALLGLGLIGFAAARKRKA